ncbi:MAG: CBS domain-containing protein [Holophagales bacterium]|jgi:CBS domain-containing protein|nr:CBS domain-containing protein [Holophagales bacterium]MBK9966615.1 CBS domain-containing protein [Holophagales bacterium]
MPTARDLLSQKKSGGVITVSPDATVKDAARLMYDHGIGSLVVAEGETLKGIFTERDVLWRVVAQGKDAATTAVRDVMTVDVIVVRPDREIDEIETILKEHRIRHVPVAGDHGLLGVLSIGDLNAFRADADHQQVEYLTGYIYGRS